MTAHYGNPSSAGLGYGLGRQGNPLTAHSSAALQAVQTALSSAVAQINRDEQAVAQQISQLAQQAAAQYVTWASTSDTTTIVYGQGLAGMDIAAAQIAAAYNRPAPPTSSDPTRRSLELLHDWLTPLQRKQLISRDCFEVVGGETGTHYWINRPNVPYNIHQYSSNGICEFKLCFVPKDRNLPLGDIWLTQKLALELDEKNTLALANRSGSYEGYC